MKTKIEINHKALSRLCVVVFPIALMALGYELEVESFWGTFIAAIVLLASMIGIFWYVQREEEEDRKKRNV
ncbi:MAG: hypothetical protein IKO26_07910 [Paludibacteraceae bacterium]|nr:hypothetical protein [Paludibacteraceae bacterium]